MVVFELDDVVKVVIPACFVISSLRRPIWKKGWLSAHLIRIFTEAATVWFISLRLYPIAIIAHVIVHICHTYEAFSRCYCSG